ncbi:MULTISPECIES: hypothetical protein [Nonomuraea]|uniref:Uncharacterized protein n=1 Tax=Nonomuraea mangrovi TaxID=2316207 RepID=A0ABW4TC89_9ACTN
MPDSTSQKWAVNASPGARSRQASESCPAIEERGSWLSLVEQRPRNAVLAGRVLAAVW